MILFLDFDGVLHPDPCNDPDQLFVHAPRLARTLMDFAHVRVVLSTSWRTAKPLPDLIAPLPPALRQRVVGITPIASSFSPPPALAPYRRHAECLRWLDDNHSSHHDWLALDDRESWFQPLCDNLILCNSQRGLDDVVARRLHSLLTLSRQRMLRGVGTTTAQ